MAFAVLVLWLSILYNFYPSGAKARQWFVSKVDGTNSGYCGFFTSSPCKNIQRAAARAVDGDVINIDGAGSSHDPYVCESETKLPLPGLTLQSYNTTAFISCKSSGFRFMCNSRANTFQEVSLKDITFTNTSLHVVSCSVKVSSCSFLNNSVLALSTSFAGDSIETVKLEGCTFLGNNFTSFAIDGGSMNLYIFNTSFAFNEVRSVESALLALSTKSSQESKSRVTVHFTNVTVTQNVCPGRACFEFVAGMNGAKITLEMEKGTLERNVIGDDEGSVLDVHGFANTDVDLKLMQFQSNIGRALKIHNGNSLELKITKSEFSDHKIYQWDGGAVLVSNFTKKTSASVIGSKFRSNIARNGGACAFVDIFSLILDIENSNFIQNEALSSGGALVVGNHNRTIEKSSIDVRSSKFIGNRLASMVSISTSVLFTNSSHKHDGSVHQSADNAGGGASAIYVSQVMTLSFANNIFADNQAETMNSGAVQALLGTLYRDVEIVNCEFLRNSGGLESGTFQLIVKSPSLQSRAILQNLTFVNNSGSSIYDVYLSQNRLLMLSWKMERNSGGGVFTGTSSNFLDVLIENTLISHNINFGCNFYKGNLKNGSVYKVKNVSFVNNTCNAKDSILRIYMHKSQSFLILQRSTFVDNFCKSGVVKISVNSRLGSNNNQVIINNAVFRNNSGFSKSTLSIFDVNEIIIQNSVFNTNFGGADGSHVRVQMQSSKITIKNTTFYQSNMLRTQPFNGFLIATSLGSIYINETSFISDLFSGGRVPLVFVEGAREVLMDNTVRIRAPLSTKLIMDNFTHLEMEKNIHSKHIISFAFITEPCPMRSYSVHRGSSQGFTVEDNFTCYACPNGGNCSSSLAARPNFWGYPIGDKIYFKLCPEGYCCQTVNQICRFHYENYLHSGCQGNRTGMLCGQCKRDFSEGLFTTRCHPVSECNQGWLLSILVMAGTLFALYLITKPPLGELLMANIRWFLPSPKQDDYNTLRTLSDVKKPKAHSKYAFSKSLFYFYQVAGVLTASSYGVHHLLKDRIASPITALLNFQLSVNNDWKICPLPGITPLSKTLFQLAFLTTVFISIPVVYLLHGALNKLRRRNPVLPPGGPYLAAVLEMFLLGYSAITGIAKNLLHCVEIQQVSRWYYDAQFTCYQWWQSTSLLVIALYLMPSIFALYFSSFGLYSGKISGKMFLLACLCPFPYLLYIFIEHVRKVTKQKCDCQERTSKTNTTLFEGEDARFLSPIEKSLLEVLCGPFSKPQDHRSVGKIYWESILIGRRFVIILICPFLEHAFLRSVCLTIICLTFLLHHIHQKPFAHFSANVVEAVSLTTLVVIAILNVGVASYYSVGKEVGGVNQTYVSYFLSIEAVLLGILPLMFAVFVSLSLVLQLVRLVTILIQTILRRWPVGRSTFTRQLSEGNQEQPLLPTSTLLP